MAYLWADLYKPVKDFFSKEYNTVPLRFEVAVNPKDEEWIAPTVERVNDGSLNLSAELGQKFLVGNHPSQGKVTVSGTGRVKVEGKVKHVGEHLGAEMNGLADIGPLDSANDKYEVTLDLRRFQGAGSLIGRFAKNKPVELEASVCYFFRKQWLFGAQALFNQSFALSAATLGASHRAPGRTIAATIDKNFVPKLGIIMAARDSPNNTEFGAEFALGKAVNLTVGVKSIVVDNTSEKVEFRGKVNNAGTFGLSMKRRLTNNVTGTFSTDIDLKNAKGTYGLKFVWN